MKATMKAVSALFAILVLFVSFPSLAWEMDCNIDSSNKKEECKLISGEMGHMALLGSPDKGVNYGLGFGDSETIYNAPKCLCKIKRA